MTRATYHHGNLRAELLIAARALMASDGLAGFSVAKLAKVARVSPAAPYRHFANRDDLVAQVAQDVGAELIETIRSAATSAGTNPADRLAATAGAYVLFVLRNGVGLELLFAPELRDRRFAAVHEQTRSLMDVLMPLAHAASADPSWEASLRLLEAHMALAQGYAALQSLGALALADLADEQVAANASTASRLLIRGTGSSDLSTGFG